MLEIDSLRKVYPDGTVALQGVNARIPAGEFCVLLGPSGAGKSTLLKLINGMQRPTEGGVRIDGQTVSSATRRRLQAQTGMVHQQFHLVPRLSVLHNVLAGALPYVPWYRSLWKRFPREWQERACERLAEVGLRREHLDRRAAELSGGQQQRVAIARAFLTKPRLVLADEPVASLDPTTSEQVLRLLRQASRPAGERDRATPTTVVCSLHQVELARQFADRVLGIADGRVVFDGPPQEINGDVLTRIYGRPDAAGDDRLFAQAEPAADASRETVGAL